MAQDSSANVKTQVFNVSTPVDMLGKAVTMYVKKTTILADSTVYGAPVVSDVNTVIETGEKVTGGDSKDGDSLAALLKGTGLATDKATEYYHNYEEVAIDSADVDDIMNVKGAALTVIDNDNDGYVNYVISVEKSLTHVSGVSSKNETTTLYAQAEQNGNVIVFSVTGKPIIPRSENQLKLVEGFAKNDMVFAIGPAGSGKTYTAIALAVRALKNKEIKKIILSRPAVEAGEKLGFLPGDMKDKIDPYLQPLYDALQDMIPAAKLKEYMELNIIQIAPLAFMRGRTLNDAVVILDEAQNTTTQQIKMFLTRMGMNTKMIVTGDMTQIDLPASQTSGLVQALRILKGVKGISFVELNKKDIVRHKLVERIVDAYEKFDKEAKAEREKRKNEQLVINGERPVKLAKD